MRSSRSHVLTAKLLCLWVLLLLSLMPAAVIAAAMRVKVIDLHYTSAEKIIPLIAPMLVEDGSVSGEGNTLVLKTTYRNLTEIRYLIQRLDKRPVALLVSIRQADKRWNSEASQLSQKSTVYQTDIPFEQNLKLLEGEVAFIDTSRQYPVVTLAGGGLWASENFRGSNKHRRRHKNMPIGRQHGWPDPWYKNKHRTGHNRWNRDYGINGEVAFEEKSLASGFWVKPRVNGDEVIVKVYQQRQQASKVVWNGSHGQMMASSVIAKLGQWVAVGGLETIRPKSNYQTEGYIRKMSVLMKVERLPRPSSHKIRDVHHSPSSKDSLVVGSAEALSSQHSAR